MELVLGGVPEQVNIPILIAIENNIFNEYGLDLHYRLVPEGTGAMLDLLENGTIDIALTVTDGFISGRAKGRRVELLGTFVSSPLIWAVAGSVTIPIISLDDLRGRDRVRVGISRLGSGSHTMAQYLSSQLGINNETVSFVVANNFEGLCKGVAEGAFDIFLWETFTTQPHFSSGILHKIGEVATPWTAFSFIGAEGSSSKESSSTSVRGALFPALTKATTIFKDPANEEASVARICKEHGHTEKDSRAWLHAVKYASDGGFSVDRERTEASVAILKEAGIVGESFAVDTLFGSSNQVVTFNKK